LNLQFDFFCEHPAAERLLPFLTFVKFSGSHRRTFRYMNTATAFEQFFTSLKQWLPVYFTVLLAGETAILLWRFKKHYWREARVNLVTGAVTIIAQAVLKTWLLTGLYPTVYENGLFQLGLHWYAWVAGFFLYTFLQFITHIGYHKIRLFWCLHEVHHSALHMNVTTGLRTSVFDIVSLDAFYLLIPFFGIHPLVYFILYSLNKFWGAFIHVNENIVSRIPVLEKLLVTPGAHHIHHARNIPYLDKNYGEIIPWYDQLLGTWAPPTEKPVYGTLVVQQELGFWDAQLHEFRRLWKDVKKGRGWRQKLGYLFLPPGWQPGDASGTTRAIQRRYHSETPAKQAVRLQTLWSKPPQHPEMHPSIIKTPASS
jgi:sterol desaturase/sphingolipid hydroxylase (fatty acid hydroxylase superfamily)